MNRLLSIITVLSALLITQITLVWAAEPFVIPGWDIIQEASIPVTIDSGNSLSVAQSFAFKILGLLKLVISGFALIFMVMIGVYMIVFSENEERVKNQRNQITYTLIGFLFLNVPGILWQVFNPWSKTASVGAPSPWTDTDWGAIFWDTYGFSGILWDMIGFLRVFVYGIAILMLTWGFFQLITSAWEEEKQKQSKNRITYGFLGLIFMGFVEIWSRLIAGWDFNSYIPTISGQLFGLALFFAAPVAIFFLMWGGYQFITSAGDEEKVKKWKTIVTNTLIAGLILIAALSFLSDLINFKL